MDLQLEELVPSGSACSERADVLRPILDLAPRLSRAPLVIATSAGEIVAGSEEQRSECAALTSGGPLSVPQAGPVSCPHATCPHHSRFGFRHVRGDGAPLVLVHCSDDEKLDLLAALAARLLDDLADRDAVLEELSRMYEELNWLYSLGEILRQATSEEVTLLKVFRHLERLLPVARAEVWTPDPAAGLYRCVVHYDRNTLLKNQETVERTPETDTILADLELRVLRKRPRGPSVAEKLLDTLTARLVPPIVTVPLETSGQFLGTLFLQLTDPHAVLHSSQVKLLAAVGRQLSLCVQLQRLLQELRENEGLKRELEIAREIQHSLLPATIPNVPGGDLYAGLVTAAHVGGDYYDFFTEQDRVGMLVADVSGHSVASALIATSFRSAFRHFLELGIEMDELLARINRSLYGELIHSGHFLSAFFCSYDPALRELRYVNAGHNRPFVLRSRTGEFIDLDEAGLLVGVVESWSYEFGRTQLEEGDILVLYTDGIVEAENQKGEFYGIDRLKHAVNRYARRSAKELYHYLLRDMYLFQDELFNKDDITLVVMKVS